MYNNCFNCGAIVNPEWSECRHCGASLPKQPPQNQQGTYPPPYQQNPQQPPYQSPPNAYPPGAYPPPYQYQPGAYPPPYYAAQQKSKIAAGLLGIFLGGLGIHNFYLGYTSKAVIQLVLGLISCGAISGIWGLIEGIMILAGSINVDGRGYPLRD